jgi:uncharacterized sporulation protein YeaH/YhbH (DUF444 family)
MTIIDRRKTNKNKSVGNRQKFIERNKTRIKHSIDSISSEKGITDALSNRKVTVDGIDEPGFNFDLSTGDRDRILPGNNTMKKGDKIYSPPQSDEEESSGSENGDGMDEFAFTLTKEEFLELYFSDLELPNFIKDSLKSTTKHTWKRAGYSKQGIPSRIDLVKTLKQGLARRVATGSERFLDDVDLRYKLFTKQPVPIRHATMILLMDTSGSMGQFEKDLAKKFFLLLYLFLNKVYKNVDVRFVSHTQVAKEVTEEEFFYGKETGGTIVSSGLTLVRDIISKLDLGSTNVYIAQASDGDNWAGDDSVSENLIDELLSVVQYFAYVQVEDFDRLAWKDKRQIQDLMTLYSAISKRNNKLQARHVTELNQVYPVLRSLFEGE